MVTGSFPLGIPLFLMDSHRSLGCSTRFCRCKTERSQNNEIRCKVLAHNLVVLIHEIFELKLEVDFNGIAKKHPAQKVI